MNPAARALLAITTVFTILGCPAPNPPTAGAAATSTRSAPEPIPPSIPTISIPHLAHRSTATLPLTTSPPAFAADAGGFVHVVAMEPGNRRAVYAALDRDGATALPARTLPLSLASAGACGSEVLATGVHETKGIRWAMGLGARGIRWETALPIPTDGLVWTLPACIAGEPAIVWEIEKDTTADLSVATVRGGRLGPPAIFPQSGVAYRLDVAAIGAALFVLRGRGTSEPAEVVRVEGGAVAGRAETARNAHAIAAAGHRLAVLSWTPQALLLDWLDPSLAPLGATETIATATAPSWIRYATLHAAGEDRIAVSYLVGAAGDLVDMPSGRSEPGEYASHFLGRYDAASRALADVSEVTPPGTAWLAGAWLGNRLLFVHGTTGAALSVFELVR